MAGALNGLENSSPPSRLKRAMKRGALAELVRLGGERGIVDHADQRILHAGAWNASRIPIVLPRPPPPGLSATSAKISAMRGASSVALARAHGVVQDGQRRRGTARAAPSRPRRSRAPVRARRAGRSR